MISQKTKIRIRVGWSCSSTASLKNPFHKRLCKMLKFHVFQKFIMKFFVDCKSEGANATTFFCCKIFGNFTDMHRIRGNSVLNQEKVRCAGNVCQLLNWNTALKLIKFYWNTTPSMIKENNKISPLHMRKFGWKCVTCATIHP